MDVVHPMNFLRIRFHIGQVEIHHDGLLPAATQHARERFDIARVDLLMRNVRRNEDEVARTRLGSEFETIAPFHPCATAHHVDDAFDRTVMMRPGLRFCVDDDGPGPQLLGARSCMRDRSGAVHSRRLRRVEIELIGMNDSYAMEAPTGFGGHFLLDSVGLDENSTPSESPCSVNFQADGGLRSAMTFPPRVLS